MKMVDFSPYITKKKNIRIEKVVAVALWSVWTARRSRILLVVVFQKKV
jgi:hypothetical protein